MKQFPVAAAAIAALVPAALADFDVYFVQFGEGVSQTGGTGWEVYDGEPSCDDVGKGITFGGDDDVSKIFGVRCKGDGCNPSRKTDPSAIEEMEMNFHEDYRFSKSLCPSWSVSRVAWLIIVLAMYKNGNYALVDTNDSQIGTCEPFPGDSFDCTDTAPIGLPHSIGDRKIRCKTDFTAQNIKIAALS